MEQPVNGRDPLSGRSFPTVITPEQEVILKKLNETHALMIQESRERILAAIASTPTE